MGQTRSVRTPGQLLGDAAETTVAEHLAGAGWTVLARNVHVGRCELDIVAVDPGPPAVLVAVEVRWRARRDFGFAEETFDWRKRRRIRDAAFGLLDRGRLPDGRPLPRLSLRFDLILVEPSADGTRAPRIRHHRHVLGG
jgi:Holliday junction resolvase-like predicted endonuclease